MVDDSPTARELLVTILQNAEGIQVVGTGSNGEEAVRLTLRQHPDVVTMDSHMPKMDGMEATRRIMRESPTPIVMVSGSMMREEVDITFEALRAGALTVVSKPGLADPETCDKVVQAVRLMADVPVIHHWGRTRQRFREAATTAKDAQSDATSAPDWASHVAALDIRVVGIAASTGGPMVLANILGALPADFPLPILLVQHITTGFGPGLANWLNTQTDLRVSLAGHGEMPLGGGVWLAPDDYHVQINARGVIELSKAPPYKGLRPSANYLFHSLASSYGARAVGITLTGMGDDGAEGLEALHRAGGLTVAQEKSSCVVYSMPHEAIVRNAALHVLTPPQIAAMLTQLSASRAVDQAPVQLQKKAS